MYGAFGDSNDKPADVKSEIVSSTASKGKSQPVHKKGIKPIAAIYG